MGKRVDRVQEVGSVGFKKVPLLDGEVVIKTGECGHRLWRRLGMLGWSGGLLILTDKRLIWTPNWFARIYAAPVVTALSEVRDVRQYRKTHFFAPYDQWLAETDSGSLVFGFGLLTMGRDDSVDWIEALRACQANP